MAAIGPGTAAALRAHGVIADVVPERFVAEGLVEALAGVPVSRALIARAAEARDVLPDALRERGAQVDVVALYETVAEPFDDGQRAAVAHADYVTFTSSSTVQHFFTALDGAALGAGTRLASIGPVTSDTLREHGLAPMSRPRATTSTGWSRRWCWTPALGSSRAFEPPPGEIYSADPSTRRP